MKKTTLMVLTLAGVLTFALVANSNMHYAFAHQTKKFGNINIEVGWANEPSLAGQLNTVTMRITTASDNKPVPNAVGQLQATIKKGGETKALDLLPQEQEGLYGAQVIPSQIGQYELVLKGTVSGQAVDGSIPLDDVADPKQLSFPAAGGAGQVDSAAMEQFRSAITDLTSQVDAAKASADQAQQAAQSAVQSTAGVKASADGAYLFGMIGVGVGVAGIVIAVIALSRREKVEGEKVPRF
ncbi:MAG: hypothetical protein C4292_00420 [Nitrososphaera sp.]